MEKKVDLICICCPMGCPMTVTMQDNNVVSVTGNTCKRGEVYAVKEVTNPTRIVTSTVSVEGGKTLRVSVKTKSDIEKSKVFDVVRALKDIKVKAPIMTGDVIVSNIAGTGVDMIATSEA